MNKNLKLALIMVIVFSPIILFLLPIGIFTLLAIPVILLVAVAILLFTEVMFRILKNRGAFREETEDLHMKRKLVWFWVNTVTAVSAMYFDLDLLAWSSFFTIPYLSRNVYQCWHDFRMKEAGFRELWKEYRKAYNANTGSFCRSYVSEIVFRCGFPGEGTEQSCKLTDSPAHLRSRKEYFYPWRDPYWVSNYALIL